MTLYPVNRYNFTYHHSEGCLFRFFSFHRLIHQLQLEISGAEVSFCAPLSFRAEIKEGDIYVSDMFNLYKYENMLYVMELSGKEIKGFLEMAYASGLIR